MLLFLLFFILAAASAYFIFQLSTVNSTQRKQLVTLMRQNNSLKTDLKSHMRSDKNPTILNIKYKNTPYKSGIIADYCPLYAAPYEESPILHELSKNTQIKILDSAETGNSIWYEISFDNKDNINNKGWIKARYMMIYDRYDLTRKI